MIRNHSLHHRRTHPRHGEQGVTLLIVAIAMVSMLAMVALAVDVITLYAARSEAQRAADAAALAAAKMLVDSGVTADPSTFASAQGYATTIAQNVAQQSSISGQSVQSANVTTSYGNGATFGTNPTVTVTVKSGTLPTFFSRIWSRNPLTVNATATAEAYNPSNSSAPGSAPVVARCVKPFLLPNCDQGALGAGCGGTATTFFNVTTGAITRPGQAPAGIIGETFNLQSNCGAGPGCTPGPPNATRYYPVQVPPAAGNACPSACGGGGTNFENDIECCNPSPLTCGLTAGTATGTLSVDTTVFPDGGGGPAEVGVKCLIHQNGGSGQDILTDPLAYPLEIQAGGDHPLSGIRGNYINTSDSLITVPVYDDIAALTSPPLNGAPPTAGAQIVGFLQLFIDQSFPGNGSWKAGTLTVTVVNVAGCGRNATGTPVFPGSTSAVPVRLIHQ